MKPIMKDPEEFPTLENLGRYLSAVNLELYKLLIEKMHEQSFNEDWNYYNDGKNWLSKILFKKKNLGWISIWETGVKVTVFFGDRIYPKLVENELFSQLEENEATIDKSGKLNAVLVPIQNETSVQTALDLIKFKKTVK